MRIVIFGAAGIVGRGLRRRLGAEHDLVLVDREPIEDPEATFVRGDVNDPALFLAVMQGAHASVYLPPPPASPHADACDASQGLDFDINVRNVYWWLAAAARLGVARTVFASSLSVFDLATSPETITEQKPPDPTAVYGLTNQLGEETCRYFAGRYAMAVVVLRLGFVCDPDRWALGGPPKPFPRTHVEDVAEAIRFGLTRPLNGFQRVHIFGERSQFGWSDRHADEVLGFRVQHRHPGHGQGTPTMIAEETNIGPRQANDKSRREDPPRRMVVYGAAGSVGSALNRRFAGTHDLLLVDRQPMEGPRNTFVRRDVCDPNTFLQTMPGADASVYLPFAPYRPGVDMCNDMSGASFDVNARGVYYWLAAALECGVRRLVLASSLSVYGYDMPDGLTKDVPPMPADVYGLTKTYGEEICRYFERKHGMSIVVLRLSGICTPNDWTRPETMAATWFLRWNRSHHRCPRTHIEDVIDAVVLALTRPFDGFHLFHVFGERGLRDWPTDDQREELGFMPRYPRFGDTSPVQ